MSETEFNDVVSLVAATQVYEDHGGDDGYHNPQSLNMDDGSQEDIKESIAEEIEEDCNGNDDSDMQEDGLNQMSIAESNNESSAPLLPDDSIKIYIEGESTDGSGNNSLGATALEKIERAFLIINFMTELSTAVFDQLSSVHNPKYALISLLMSLMMMMISIIILVHKGFKENVKWMRRGKIAWFYYPSPAHDKPFGTFPDIIGIACAFSQSISTAITYGFFMSRHANSPVKISAWPVIFAGGLLWCGFKGCSYKGKSNHDQFQRVRSLEPIDHRGNRTRRAAVEHLEMLKKLEELKLLKNLGRLNLLEMVGANFDDSGELVKSPAGR